MMHRTFALNKNLLNFGIPLSLLGGLILVMKSPVLAGNETLVMAITVDLLLTVPLIYFLLIRKSKIPKISVIPVLIIGLLIGSFFLPKEDQQYLQYFKTWILPFLELAVLSYVFYKLRKAIIKFKENEKSTFDFFTSLKDTCYDILPRKAVMPVVTEIGVFYYGFIYWKRRKLKANEFSYHKDSGTIALLVVILFLVAIETAAIHILLSKWSDAAAWVLTFLSMYSGIQIFGFLKSMFKRPISLEKDQLHLRYGMMTETTIDLQDIDSLEISSKDLEPDKETRKLSLFGELESHNIIIRLKKENELTGLYGIKRKYRNLAFYVDDTLEFENQIHKALQKHI
ncbi:hypothetical protein [Psychroflexus aurantiacus]|nr:hypothetical protein [Psychroflexus aurantiacus]